MTFAKSNNILFLSSESWGHSGHQSPAVVEWSRRGWRWQCCAPPRSLISRSSSVCWNSMEDKISWISIKDTLQWERTLKLLMSLYVTITVIVRMRIYDQVLGKSCGKVFNNIVIFVYLIWKTVHLIDKNCGEFLPKNYISHEVLVAAFYKNKYFLCVIIP